MSLFKRFFSSAWDVAFQAFWGAVIAAILAAAAVLYGKIAGRPEIVELALTALVTCGVIGILAVLIGVLRRKLPSSGAAGDTSGTATIAEQLRLVELGKQYLRLMQDDSRQMWKRIHVHWAGVQVDAHLDAVDPFAHLIVEFVNATVFEVTPHKLEGFIRYNSDPLRAAPELIAVVKGLHGEGFRVVIRQWLSSETARQFKQQFPVALRTGNLALIFRYVDGNGETKDARYAFPDEGFTIRS